MKKTRSLLLTGASLALAAVLAIGGSLAYYTDRDAKTNVFTVGNVDIELTEDFEQGAELVPGVDINKDVQITNTGKNDAWVWYTYAVPTALVDTGNNASKNAIHFNLEGAYWDSYASDEQKATGKTWHWEDIDHNQKIDDSDILYTVVTVLYNTTLAVDETTPVSLTNVYLDTRVDIDPDGNMHWVENGVATDLNWNVNTLGAPKIYVAAYGIQAETFADVNAAYAAYGKQWGENGGAEYPAAPFAEVSGVADLQKAIADGVGKIVLTNDVAFAATDLISDASVTSLPYALAILSDTEIDLNGNDIIFEDTDNGTVGIFVHDANLTITGEGEVTQKGSDDFLLWAKGASVVDIYDGTYTACGDDSSVFYASGNTAWDPTDDYATINVYGGTFISESSDTQDYANVMNHGVGKVNYYGGTFNWNPATDVDVDDRAHIKVADGYTVVDNGDGTYTVATASVSNTEELASAIASVTAGEKATIALAAGEYTTNLKIAGGSDIEIVGSKATVLSGQIATTASNAGTLTIKGVTINVDEKIVDTTGISQTGKSAIAIWGDQTVICENVTFNMSLADSTAITSWWDTGIGTSIVVKNCTFNCNGQRPIRATGNVTVENCTFNDPYRYAVQLTAKASTATLLDKAIINFNNNTIVDGVNGKALVYGIQLEGADYGCHDCVINGSGNTIVDGGSGSAMYYCECGIVNHDTIEWNVEVDPVHES